VIRPTLATRLPKEELEFLELLVRVPLWQTTESSDDLHVVSKGDVSIRFSVDASPRIVAPTVPHGYPLALAMFTWRCVSSSDGMWSTSHVLGTAAQWQRISAFEYHPGWQNVVDWIQVAPADLLGTAHFAFGRSRPFVRTDDDAASFANALHDSIAKLPNYRLSGFIARLEDSAATVARDLLAEGARISTFLGPEPMDSWHLTLERGPVVASFVIERGIPEGIAIRHRDFRNRHRAYVSPQYPAVWLAWAERTGAPTDGFDPADPHRTADYTAWRAVFDWLTYVATLDELVAIGDLAG
jgi:GNAT superfamily N-acetyltransferase